MLFDELDPFSIDLITDAATINGRTFTTTYNGTTGAVTQTSPEGRQVVSVLDVTGRPLSSHVGALLPSNFTYDAFGRLASTSQGLRGLTNAYGPDGYLDSTTDAIARTQGFGTDSLGRVTTATRPDGQQTLMSYDGEGNTTSVTPPGRPAHDFGFSPVELLTSYSPPPLPSSATDTTWFYDLDRKLETQQRPGPELLSYGYDTAGRLTSTVADLGTIGRTYDPTTGKLTTLSGPGAITLDFDYDGRLLTTVTWSGAVSATLTKTYDDDFFMVEEAVSGASSVLYAYDLDGLGIAVGDLAITRDPDTGLVTSTAASNVTDATGHNGHGEVGSYGASHLGTALYDFVLVRDDIGRIIQKTETVEGTTTVYDYGYDLAGRLETVTTDGVLSDTYAYDANGNRLSHDTPTETVFGSYDVQDRLVTYGEDAYAFLDSGELSQNQNLVSGDTTDYVYDAFGNLREVTLPDGTLIEYEADGRGRRTAKYVDGVLEQAWLWREQLQPVAELDGAGNVTATFVYGDSPNVPELVVTSGATYRLIKDHLGSVRLVVDVDTGVVAQRIDYDAWGVVTADTNPGLQPFGFAGGLYDADTGLVRFGARDYEAGTGRWTTKDPIRFQGGDSLLYRYAEGDPVNRADYNGLDGGVLTGGSAAAAAAAVLGTAIVLLFNDPFVRRMIDDAIDELDDPPLMCEEPDEEEDEDGCEEEWATAHEECAKMLRSPNPPRGVTGRKKNIRECARGLVSERCGGNPVSY